MDYENNNVNQNEIVSTKEWLLSLLVAIMPIVNIILFIKWAIGGPNVKTSKRNFFRAYWVLFGIMMAVMIAITGVLLSLGISFASKNMNSLPSVEQKTITKDVTSDDVTDHKEVNDDNVNSVSIKVGKQDLKITLPDTYTKDYSTDTSVSFVNDNSDTNQYTDVHYSDSFVEKGNIDDVKSNLKSFASTDDIKEDTINGKTVYYAANTSDGNINIYAYEEIDADDYLEININTINVDTDVNNLLKSFVLSF